MACSGTPNYCYEHWLQYCVACGCLWNTKLDLCGGDADACSSHSTQSACENCGCNWGTNLKINVGDVWRDVEEIKINVSDTWRTVTEIWINVGDVWRQVF